MIVINHRKKCKICHQRPCDENRYIRQARYMKKRIECNIDDKSQFRIHEKKEKKEKMLLCLYDTSNKDDLSSSGELSLTWRWDV